jgi:hypothetical protein
MPSQGADPTQQIAPSDPALSQDPRALEPSQQILMFEQNIKSVLDTFSGSFPGGEEKIRMAMGLISEAVREKVQTLEQMQGPQPTSRLPY